MALDITLQHQSVQRNAPDITFRDWQLPETPGGGFLNAPSWRDATDISVPGKTLNKPFPDYMIINPQDIQNGIKSIVTAPDVALGAAKQFVPGLAGLGDAFGSFGKSIDQSPLGGIKSGVEGAVGFAGNIVEETIAAIGNRAGTILGEIGHTFDSTNPDPFKLIDAPLRVAGAAVLGQTGAAAFDFGKPIDSHIWDNLPKDIMDSVAVAGVIPLARGAGLIGKSLKLGETGAGLFGRGLIHPLESLADATMAESVGAYAGRTSLALTGAGLATEYVVPKIAPNEPWARDIMNNRVISEESSWRMPFELATTLPLDVFQLGRIAAKARLTSYGAKAVFGTHDAIAAVTRIPLDEVRNAINGGVTTTKNLSLMTEYGIRKTAEDVMVEIYNATKPAGASKAMKITEILDDAGNRMTQGVAVQKVKIMVDKLFEKWGPAKLYERAGDVVAGKFDGWAGLDTAGKLQHFNDYSEIALKYESMFPDKLVSIADDVVNQIYQAPRALDYLEHLKETGSVYDKELFLNRYPSLRTGILQDHAEIIEDAMMQLKSIVKSDSGDIASLRAQLRETNAKMVELQAASDAATAAPSAEANARPAKARGVESGAIRKGIPQEGFTIQGLQKTAQDLENQIFTRTHNTIGGLEARLDTINKRIVKGEVSLRSERDSIVKALNAAHEESVIGTTKQIEVLQASRAAREEESFLRTNVKGIEPGLDLEYDAMSRELSALTEKFYQDSFRGSRWELSIHEGTPVMRLMDETGRTFTPGTRTTAGKVFDTLFGAIPDKRLGYQTDSRIRGAYSSSTTPDKLQEALDKLREVVDDNTTTTATGMRRSKYGSVYHLPPLQINKVFERLKIEVPEGYKSHSEVFYRAFPGPLKIFQEQVFGKELMQMPYNEMFHNVSRSLYPQLRFFFSPRFFFMNYLEPKIIGTSLGGAQFLKAPLDKASVAYAMKFQRMDRAFNILDTGQATARNLVKLGYTMRPDAYVRDVLEIIAKQPEMADAVKALGTKDKWYQALSDTMTFRENVIKAANADSMAEKALAEKIKSLEANLKTGFGDELGERAEIERLSKEYSQMKTDAEISKEMLAQHLEMTREIEPIIDSLKFTNYKIIEDTRQIFNGNPARSAVERLANSFLVYWPISYQIKATKDLVRFLGSRAFGFPTGMTGANAYEHFRAEHQRKMATDPVYAEHMKANHNLLFLVENMLPVTPEGIGVSLSPFIRAPQYMLSGKESPSQAVGRFNFGPAYDLTLAQRIIAEQTKKNGILHDAVTGE